MEQVLTILKWITFFVIYTFQISLCYSIVSLIGFNVVAILFLIPVAIMFLEFNKNMNMFFDNLIGNISVENLNAETSVEKPIYPNPVEFGTPLIQTEGTPSKLNVEVKPDDFRKKSPYIAIEPYSFSRVRMFVDCRYRFYQKYVLKSSQGYESKSAQIGKEVHQSIANLLSAQKSIKSMNEEIFRYELRRLEGTLPHEQFKDARRFLSKFQKQTILQSHEKIISIENKFEEVLPSGRKFVWIADLIVASFDGSYLKVIDFKTGRVPKDVDYQYFENKQVQIYAAFAMKRFSYSKSRATFHYIQKDQKFESKLSDADAQYLLNYLDKKCVQIENEEEFRPSPGTTCYFCEFRDTCKSALVRRAA